MMGSDCRNVNRKMIETELYFMKDPVANGAEGKIKEKSKRCLGKKGGNHLVEKE